MIVEPHSFPASSAGGCTEEEGRRGLRGPAQTQLPLVSNSTFHRQLPLFKI